MARLALFGVVLAMVVIKVGDAANGWIKADSACSVLRLVDGDTIDAWCPEQGVVRSRLTGFDTAEIFSPGCFEERITGYRGLLALRLELFAASQITLISLGYDRYDRRLMAVKTDGELLADRMIAREVAVRYQAGRRIDWCERIRHGKDTGAT